MSLLGINKARIEVDSSKGKAYTAQVTLKKDEAANLIAMVDYFDSHEDIKKDVNRNQVLKNLIKVAINDDYILDKLIESLGSR